MATKTLLVAFALICAFTISAQALSIDRNSLIFRLESNDKSSSPLTSSSSSSSSSSAGDEETVDQKDDHESDICAFSKGTFLKDKRCRPCSECGPDLYERQRCTPISDTVCDWCLTPFPIKNRNFQLKCTDVIRFQKEFQQLIGKREDESKDSMAKAIYAEYQGDSQPIRFASWTVSPSWKLQMIMEACFYLALIALIFVIIRFISKSKPYYRTVTVDPPVLDENDNKNIIRAAEHIRQKLGKKGYDRLEEFI